MDGFYELVSEIWQKSVTGSPFFIWEEKLRRLKAALKSWAKIQPSPVLERKKAQRELRNHQLLMEDATITPELINVEANLQKALYNVLRREEQYWRIKARCLWLKDGDKNTSFFHKHAEARKNYNSIREIHFQDQTLNKVEEIKNSAHSFYKDLFTEDLEDPPSLDRYPLNVIPTLINEDENRMMIAPITTEEIYQALLGMNPDKAPGPDHFTARFYTACWDII